MKDFDYQQVANPMPPVFFSFLFLLILLLDQAGASGGSSQRSQDSRALLVRSLTDLVGIL